MRTVRNLWLAIILCNGNNIHIICKNSSVKCVLLYRLTIYVSILEIHIYYITSRTTGWFITKSKRKFMSFETTISLSFVCDFVQPDQLVSCFHLIAQYQPNIKFGFRTRNTANLGTLNIGRDLELIESMRREIRVHLCLTCFVFC